MIDRPPALSHRPCGLGPVTGFLFRLVGVIACATALFSLTASVASTQTAPAAKVQKVTALTTASTALKLRWCLVFTRRPLRPLSASKPP